MKNLRRDTLLCSRIPVRERLGRLPAVCAVALLFCCGAVFGQAQPVPQPVVDTVGASGSAPMDAFMRARRTVEKYFEQAANVVCTENVTQAVIGKNGKADYREESIFDYQLQVNTNSGSLKLVESRDTRKAAFRDSARTLLITNGFTSMLLIIHPVYESSYTFEPAGEESIDGATFAKINFKAIPGASSPAALQLRGQNYPIPLSGTIWVEQQTGSVAKLIATMDSSLSDLGLQGMRSEIHYATVHFHDPEESYWMPVSAVIDVETPRQHWRNIHRFAGYKRFRATIQVEEAEKKP
jgi:hypothetical protein